MSYVETRKSLALPNFFIAGAPKAGTTSLYHYLKQHPEIYMSPVKEPCYFASEVRLEHFDAEFASSAKNRIQQLREYLDGPMTGQDPGGIVADWQDYRALFKNVNREAAIGEASVCYLWSPTAARNISAKLPAAKIILLLRDPAERAFSQYLQYAAQGLVRRSFREQIQCSARNSRHEFQPLYPFLEYGLYAAQVKTYLNLFPRENVQIYFYEEAWKDPHTLLRSIFEYLNVDASFRADTSRRSLERQAPRSLTGHYLLKKSGITPHLKKWIPQTIQNRLRPSLVKSSAALRMDPSDRAYLRDYYREDILKLSSLLNREFATWLA